MNWLQIITAAVAVLSLLLNVGIAIVGATWGIARLKAAVGEEIAKHRADFDGKLEGVERNAGETAAALRNKVHELELWVRDTFVRRDSFLTVIQEVKGGIAELGKQLDKRLDRIESRLYGGPERRDV